MHVAGLPVRLYDIRNGRVRAYSEAKGSLAVAFHFLRYDKFSVAIVSLGAPTDSAHDDLLSESGRNPIVLTRLSNIVVLHHPPHSLYSATDFHFRDHGLVLAGKARRRGHCRRARQSLHEQERLGQGGERDQGLPVGLQEIGLHLRQRFGTRCKGFRRISQG